MAGRSEADSTEDFLEVGGARLGSWADESVEEAAAEVLVTWGGGEEERVGDLVKWCGVGRR